MLEAMVTLKYVFGLGIVLLNRPTPPLDSFRALTFLDFRYKPKNILPRADSSSWSRGQESIMPLD